MTRAFQPHCSTPSALSTTRSSVLTRSSSVRHRLAALAVGGVLAVIALVALAAPASAHAQLESTVPPEGSILAHSPEEVVLHFGEPVEIDFGSVRVLGPKGQRVDRGSTEHVPGDSHSIETALPAGLPRGSYVVAWHVISADSHPVHGAFVFSIGAATHSAAADAEATSIASASGSVVVGIIYGFIRFAAFAGLIVLVGVGFVATLIWPGVARARRIRRLLWASWGLLALVTVGGVLIQGVYASQLPLSNLFRPSIVDAVLHTRFGEVEVLRLILLVLVVPFLFALTSDHTIRSTAWRRGWFLVGAVLGLFLLATPGLAGHATTGTAVALGTVADLVHLVGVSLWLGGLAVLACVLLPGGNGPDDYVTEFGSGVRRVSTVAFWAVMAVVASGVAQSIRQVGSLFGLFHTAYGVTLLVKVGLVCVLIALGAVSRRAVHGSLAIPLLSRRPRRSDRPLDHAGTSEDQASGPVALARPGAVSPATAPGGTGIAVAEGVIATSVASGPDGSTVRRLRRSVFAEVVVALLVLAVTALLVNAEPAKEAVAQPYSGSVSALGVQVNVILDPARAATDNEFEIYVLGPTGAPKAIPELDLTISLPSRGIQSLPVALLPVGPGHYLAAGVDIPYAGNWQINLTVRTSAIDEQQETLTAPVH